MRSILLPLAAVSILAVPLFAQSTTRASLDSSGNEEYLFPSRDPAISGDGNVVAWVSQGASFTAGDTNSVDDIFVRDLTTGVTTRVSVDSGGALSNGTSFKPALSYDGQRVVFASYATNLVVGDTNGQPDIFMHDRATGVTSRISVDSAGAQANSASEDSAISDDGTAVVFYSFASNLVPGDTNSASDCFVRDLVTGTTTRVSINDFGDEGNSVSGQSQPGISENGQFVVFQSFATNLVLGDTNAQWDVFVHDRATGLTERVSVSSTGIESSFGCTRPSISDNGQIVSFDGFGDDLVTGDTNLREDCFVHDRSTGMTTRVSVDSAGAEATWGASFCQISGDGNSVIFFSTSTNLVAGDANGLGDTFVHDLGSATTELVSVDSAGMQANGQSGNSAVSTDGQSVAFSSFASNLVASDFNSLQDVFVRDRGGAPAPLLSLSAGCGGPVTATITNVTPFGAVGLGFGPPGVFVIAGGPCAGTTIGVSPPTLIGVFFADATGTLVVPGFAPAGACGLGVQAVDVMTCTPTNVVIL